MKKVLKLIDNFVKWVVGLSLGLIAIIVSLQVFSRFILNNPLSWPEELSRIIFIYLVFIGGALASNEKAHISVDIIDQLDLPKPVERIIFILRYILIVIVMYFTFVGSLNLIPISANIRLSATKLPMSIMVIPIAIGSILMLFYAFVYAVQDIFKLVKKDFD
jgi:TRAP-type C4-dicarboxylate transport system permease small subunit